jgi:RNA binding exosome subunit
MSEASLVDQLMFAAEVVPVYSSNLHHLAVKEIERLQNMLQVSESLRANLARDLTEEIEECMEQAKLVVMFADRWDKQRAVSDQLYDGIARSSTTGDSSRLAEAMRRYMELHGET